MAKSKLIIEDGSMPQGANSYASTATIDKWQAARNNTDWTIPDDPDNDPNQEEKDAAAIKATDFINGLRPKGKPRLDPVTGVSRVMIFPQDGLVDPYGRPVPNDVVPPQVVVAQCYLSGLSYSGTDLQPILERGGRVQSEQVGPIRRAFFDDAGEDVYTFLVGLLGPYFYGLEGDTTSGNTLQQARVKLR